MVAVSPYLVEIAKIPEEVSMGTQDVYNRQEIETVKAEVLETGGEATCPRCGGKFKQRVVGGGGSISTIIEYRCEDCGRDVSLSDLLV